MAVDASGRAAQRMHWWPVVLAAALCLALRIGEHRFGLDLADEGFHWYGAQRLLQGELPLRDFQAYDPGRYFWSAAWMWLTGDQGIVSLRWSNSLLAAITVGIAAWTIRPPVTGAGIASLAAAGLILSVWVGASDSFAVILLMLGLTRLVERPSLARYFQLGLCWGVAAMIGMNHALYGAIAGLLAFLYLRGAPGPARAAAAAGAGAVVGYVPVLALHAAASGFTWAFLDSITLLFEAGTTNITLPFPRPWAFLHIAQKGYLVAAAETLMGLALVLVPVLWGYTGWRLLRPGSRSGVPPVTVAGLMLSLPYAHYFYSRADIGHFALSVLPVLAAVLAWSLARPPRRSWPILGALLMVSVAMAAILHSAAYQFLRGQLTTAVDIDGHRLRVRPEIADQIRTVQRVARAAGPGQFFAGPYLPGAYALTRRKSPTWEIYMLFPATLPRQQAEVERLRAANVRHAVINDLAVDGRPDLGIRMTHPHVFAYLIACRHELETVSTVRLALIRPVSASCS